MKQKGQSKQNTKKEFKQSKTKHKQVALDDPMQGHWSIRLALDKPTRRRRCNLLHWWEKSQVAPDDPTMPNWSVGVITRGCTREHVKRVEAKSLASDDPTSTGALRRSNDVSRQLKNPSAPDDLTPTG